MHRVKVGGVFLSELFEYYSNIRESEVEWLWYPYIPYGKVTLLQGDPGEGKSTFAIHLASLLSNGKDMPDGYKTKEAINVVYQCAEDGLYDTIKPRLLSANADCEKMIHIIDNDDELTLDDSRIEKVISKSSARLIILDPLQAYIGGDNDMQSAVKMRSLFRKLSIVAEKYKCAVLLVGHMNKNSGGKNLYRGLGSIDIAALCRSILMLVRDEYEPSKRYVFQIKNNLAREGKTIVFEITDKGFRWKGSSDIKIEEVLFGSVKKLKKQDVAKKTIIKLLEDGPQKSSEIYKIMESKGISKRTAKSVKSVLDIKSFRKNNIWYWSM